MDYSPQTPLSMRFPGQEYWSALQVPSPRALPDPGIKPTSPALQVDSSLMSHPGSLSVLCEFSPKGDLSRNEMK